ncbi:MAG: hypothetical protein KZQ88_17425 [Candidatus Thiodiazotropha sp. (ex Dulcina madagascariensis)]|nr:hypothetical protein [Candidatus Thiodiazotropha sp. (ex Dulcina madagascariensis)]MCU7928171.1 hypothetical protein [Candidatus Thiodiazotropha sp. (ex Dulcina madagascariensis)]
MSVSIAAKALLYDRQADSGLVGTLFRQDENKGAVFVDRVTVPIVDYASDRVDRTGALDGVEDGSYLVQLALPNGEIMTEGFEVVQGEDTKLVVVIPHDGPHEWSSLQALTGQFAPGGMAYDRDVPHVDSGAADYGGLRRDPEHGFQLRFIDMESADARHSLLQEQALPRLASLIAQDLSVPDAAGLLGVGAEVESTSEEDKDFALFEFVRQGCIGDGAERGDFYFGPGTEMTRSYLLELSARGASLICLPAPWTRMGYDETEIQLLLDKRSLESEPEYTLTIGDPMVNSALGYIRNGALHEAARLIDFDASRELLFNKISSPLAATIGGYLLVLGLDRSAYQPNSENWKNWVDNLYGWFEWLPDGAILKSAKYFVLGDKDRDGALEALMAAYDRGLPFFTFGLNLMLEGMRRFANEGEVAAQERLPILEAIAAVTDPSHNFLTVQVSRHWP